MAMQVRVLVLLEHNVVKFPDGRGWSYDNEEPPFLCMLLGWIQGIDGARGSGRHYHGQLKLCHASTPNIYCIAKVKGREDVSVTQFIK